MEYQREYEKWLAVLKDRDDEAYREMLALDAGGREAAFAATLSFGTGGLRAKRGIGPGLMNRYTVARATRGLAECILQSDEPKSCAIAYDTRHGSREYARVAAGVLLAAGIDVYLYDCPAPTPTLSWTVREKRLGWGVVITASHNPKQYNGYKVYDHRGVQAVPEVAERIMACIDKVAFFQAPEAELSGEKLHWLGKDQVLDYAARVARIALRREESLARGSELKLVYSALHGTGAVPVVEALRRNGFSPVAIQLNPDGEFGGLYMPNPEDPRVYAMALREAEQESADILLATDPDCDRVGVQVRNAEGGFTALNGNQIGALLIDYLTRDGVPGDRRMITTIVSGELAQLIAKKRCVPVTQVLTGFKYIGDVAERWPEGVFLFGYEESYGYLTGGLARDKDASVAGVLICEMALHYKLSGEGLLQRLETLEKEFGYAREKTISKHIEGVEYMRRISGLMDSFRAMQCVAGLEILEKQDFLDPDCRPELPRADVLKWIFPMGWIAVRPSGTEPNIKFYVEALGTSRDASVDAMRVLEDAVSQIVPEE